MGHAIFQYGTAFHLAVLTVAPLFLQAFCRPTLHAAFLAWLAVLAAIWVLMNPSQRRGEWPRDARARIGWEILRDPFFLFGIVALVLAGVRAINGGVTIAYDISTHLWRLTESHVPLLPGSVTGAGLVPLAGTLGLVVVTLGVRHALDSSARRLYLVFSSVLAALLFLGLWRAAAGGAAIPRLVAAPTDPFALGTLLGVYFLFAVVVWVESWFRGGAVLELAAILPLAVLLFGLLLYAPTTALWAFLPAGILALAAGVALTALRRPILAWARSAVFFLIVLFPVALLVAGEISRPPLWPVLTENFLALRAAASAVALAAWKGATQLGLGLGAYPSAMGFFATPADWQSLSTVQTAAPNGWIHLLFERGVLGAVVFAAGLGLLLRDGILRYIRAGSGWRLTGQHLLGPLVLLAVAADLFVDCSYMQIEALMSVGAALGLTTAAFPDAVEEDYG